MLSVMTYSCLIFLLLNAKLQLAVSVDISSFEWCRQASAVEMPLGVGVTNLFKVDSCLPIHSLSACFTFFVLGFNWTTGSGRVGRWFTVSTKR